LVGLVKKMKTKITYYFRAKTSADSTTIEQLITTLQHDKHD